MRNRAAPPLGFRAGGKENTDCRAFYICPIFLFVADHTETPAVIEGAFTRLEPARRVALGWASVVSVGGADIVDKQDDILDLDSLDVAVHGYMIESRETGEMHRTFGIGKVVGSLVVTPEKLSALGMTSDRMGWVVEVFIEDMDVWAKVVDGTYPAFSIGGVGIYDEAAA